MPLSPEAQGVLAYIRDLNKDLLTFKASGRITIRHKGELKFNQRAFWAGEGMDKLRLTILGIDGRPYLSMVRDGSWLHTLSHLKGELEKYSIGDRGFQRLTQIEISPDDFSSFLLGHIPLPNHRQVEMIPAVNGGSILALNRRWGKPVQRIYFREEPLQIYRVETFNSFGNLSYKVDLATPRKQGEVWVPTRIAISDGQNDRLTIEIQRYWPNVHLPVRIFTLEPPDGSHGDNG